jgi:hypothetical protein
MKNVITLCYQSRGGDFLCARFHRTSYGGYEPFDGAVWTFNEVIGTVCESRQVGIVDSFDLSVFSG